MNVNEIKSGASDYIDALKSGNPTAIAGLLITGGISFFFVWLLLKKNSRYKKAVRILNSKLRRKHRRYGR